MCEILNENEKLIIELQVGEKGRWDESENGECSDQNTMGAYNVR